MEKKKKVLMLGPDRSVHGGISSVVNQYYEAGLSEWIDLTYIGTMVEGSKIRKLFQAGMAYFKFCFCLSFCDIVHIHMASDNSYYRKAVFIRTAKRLGKKIVIHQHGGDFPTFYQKQLNDKGRERVRKTLSMADVFLVLAPAWKSFFENIVDAGKIVVFPNRIQIPDLAEKHYGQKKLLFLGRICIDKGIRELLGAVLMLRRTYPDLHLYLGGIWEEEELKREILRYPETITFLGWVAGEEKTKILQECDLFVLPTYYEGQPVSVLEAMAAGCVVIASSVGGIPQMIEDGKTGMLILPKNQQALEEAIEKALGDTEYDRGLGKAAREKAQKEFSIEKSIEELVKLYGNL